MLKKHMLAPEVTAPAPVFTQEGIFDSVFGNTAKKDRETNEWLESHMAILVSFQPIAEAVSDVVGKRNLFIEYDQTENHFHMALHGTGRARGLVVELGPLLGDPKELAHTRYNSYQIDKDVFVLDGPHNVSGDVHRFTGGAFPGDSYDDWTSEPGVTIVDAQKDADVWVLIARADSDDQNAPQVSGTAVVLLLNSKTDPKAAIKSALTATEKDAKKPLSKRQYPVISHY